MFQVLISSIGYASSVIADKIILSKYRVPVIRFIPLLFVWLAVITAAFLHRWGKIDMVGFLNTRNLIIFVLMIIVAVVWNIFYYKGIQSENLHEFELIMLLSPLATIMFAEIFLPSERNFAVFVAGLIASLALIATRFRAHHFKIGVNAKITFLAMILMSFESILIKELLGVFSPVALYFVRTLVIAIVFIIYYRPKILQMPRNAYGLVILSAMFGVVQMILKFYGFQNLGVVETTMILVLGPFLVYIASNAFFKERLYKRDIFAALVVVFCILYIQFWK